MNNNRPLFSNNASLKLFNIDFNVLLDYFLAGKDTKRRIRIKWTNSFNNEGAYQQLRSYIDLYEIIE